MLYEVITNLPPDTRGRIPDDIAKAAEAFGEELRRRFANPIASTDGVNAGTTIELAWSAPQEFNTIVTMENLVNGQKIRNNFV